MAAGQARPPPAMNQARRFPGRCAARGTTARLLLPWRVFSWYRLARVAVRAHTGVSTGIDRRPAKAADGAAGRDDLLQLEVERQATGRTEVGPQGGFIPLFPRLEGQQDDMTASLIDANGHAANFKLIASPLGEPFGGLRRAALVLDLSENLHQRQVQCLKLLLLHPQVREPPIRPQNPKAEGALPRLAERLGVDRPNLPEVGAHELLRKAL